MTTCRSDTGPPPRRHRGVSDPPLLLPIAAATMWEIRPSTLRNNPGNRPRIYMGYNNQPLKERRQHLARVADRVGDPLPLRLAVQQVALDILPHHAAQRPAVQPAQEAAQHLVVAPDGARAVVPVLQVGQEPPVEDPVVSDPAQLPVLIQPPVVFDLALELPRAGWVASHARCPPRRLRHGDHIVPRAGETSVRISGRERVQERSCRAHEAERHDVVAGRSQRHAPASRIREEPPL